MVQTVLVTGAGGYLGRHVVRTLLDRGARVRAVGRGDIDRHATRLCEDISDAAGYIHNDGLPDACLHLAWRNGFRHDETSHIEELSTHFAFLRQVVEAGVPKLTVLGTMHEVGYWEGAVEEETPCHPRTLYGIAKNALRLACFRALADKASLRWIRAYYITGDDTRSNSVFAKILAAEEAGQPRFPLNSGRNRYDFISVQELAQQIAAVTLDPDAQGVINCCSGNAISLGERVESFIAEHHLAIRPEYGVFPDRPYDSPALWGDATQIRAIMNRSMVRYNRLDVGLANDRSREGIDSVGRPSRKVIAEGTS